MGKFDGVLLVSDFDDTLYDHTFHIPQRNLDALDYFVGEGGRFTVATGRAHRTFAAYVGLSPVNAPVILSNGASIYDFEQGCYLEQTCLPDSAPRDLGEVLAQFPSLAMEAYHGDDIYVWNPNEITFAHLKKVGCDYTLSDPEQIPVPWGKVLFHQSHAVLLQVRDWLLERHGESYEAIFSNRHYLEITRKGSTKGGMVDKLVRHLGMDPSHVYCVGDNQNDIPMMERSAIPFAPANCAQEVRDWGATVLCHCNDGVIGDIMEILDKRY